MIKKHLRFAIAITITLALCYFPLCYRIDALCIRQWDESRNAVNALEMFHNHNFIVRYYDGSPENWETKPPLLIWLQVASMKLFGMNELGIRFPTILATVATVFLLIFYFRRSISGLYTGCTAALVLVTSNGYIDRHIARTGDHDALLIFFLLALILLFFRYIKATNPQKYLMPLMALLFTLAVFTKASRFFLFFRVWPSICSYSNQGESSLKIHFLFSGIRILSCNRLLLCYQGTFSTWISLPGMA